MENKKMNMEQFLSIMEYPFVYKGMTLEAFNKEKKYYGEHFEEVKSGKYIPLWKQEIGDSGN